MLHCSVLKFLLCSFSKRWRILAEFCSHEKCDRVKPKSVRKPTPAHETLPLQKTKPYRMFFTGWKNPEIEQKSMALYLLPPILLFNLRTGQRYSSHVCFHSPALHSRRKWEMCGVDGPSPSSACVNMKWLKCHNIYKNVHKSGNSLWNQIPDVQPFFF